MVLPLRLVTFNAYLISPIFNQNRITNPERRASRIQRFLQAHDLCFLQEVWGVGLSQLMIPSLAAKNDTDDHCSRKSIMEPLQVPLWRTAFLGRWLANSRWSEFLYTIIFQVVLQTGGLYDMVRPNTAHCVYRSKHTFSQSRSKSLKGVEATLWTDIAPWDYRYDLLVFNTHLDPWVAENRQQQVNEIINFIKTTIHQIDDQLPDRQKRNAWSTTGVLVVGDFNIKADTEEYRTLLTNRGWKDCMAIASSKEISSKNIVQDDHTYDQSNALVSFPEDCGRIDYMFMIDSVEEKAFLPLHCLTCHTCRQAHGDELSDHYPIVAQIVPSPEVS